MAEDSFLEILPNDSLTKTFRNECNCLPSCTSIEYRGDIDRVKFNWQAFNLDDGSRTYSKLTISFREQKVDTYKRMEIQTYTVKWLSFIV